MIPAQDDTLLSENSASFAQNTFLDSGALQGLKAPKSIHTLGSGKKYAFRVPLGSPDKNHISNSYWLEFDDPDTNVLQSPVANDAYERFYFASPTAAPQYNTKARITAGSSAYLLGIPTPATAPSVSPTGGVSGTTEIRAYVYTWVSAYGEEGPPSPPAVKQGAQADSWTVQCYSPTTDQALNRNITGIRIYRSVTSSQGIATYFFVTELTLPTTQYIDSISDEIVTANNQLSTTGYTPPPTDLKGMIMMPNGMIAGFTDKEIYFCEPYLPHAWPVAYAIDRKSTRLNSSHITLTRMPSSA